MTADAQARRELQEVLVESIGPKHTDTLLSYLPPTGWADVATTRDVHALGAEIRGEIGRLEGKIGSLESRFQRDLRVQTVTIVALILTLIGTLVGLSATGPLG